MFHAFAFFPLAASFFQPVSGFTSVFDGSGALLGARFEECPFCFLAGRLVSCRVGLCRFVSRPLFVWRLSRFLGALSHPFVSQLNYCTVPVSVRTPFRHRRWGAPPTPTPQTGIWRKTLWCSAPQTPPQRNLRENVARLRRTPPSPKFGGD